MKFGLYYISTPHEVVMITNQDTLEDAYEFFYKIKDLPSSSFNSIFTVKEIK